MTVFWLVGAVLAVGGLAVSLVLLFLAYRAMERDERERTSHDCEGL